ncbi:hypothetical protein RFI_29153 [Reticulomyxa filosa]|uniref:non-specific serine/threonine protein kinase n=1 Tax=Reticulomyxa filosa TaxID=46433 RepID=X6M437_RETFI|nr:hypothetical protein RFI_29153 [Reticulomyxa filosa]|eukprot:ETO08237.1 hypothetical protein RFI_29153 [Reticulomyxa filosa]
MSQIHDSDANGNEGERIFTTNNNKKKEIHYKFEHEHKKVNANANASANTNANENENEDGMRSDSSAEWYDGNEDSDSKAYGPVQKRLGWGHFSTVWLATDELSTKNGHLFLNKITNTKKLLNSFQKKKKKRKLSSSEDPQYVALKIQKSAPHYFDAAQDEIQLLTDSRQLTGDTNHIVQMFDSFFIESPNGTRSVLFLFFFCDFFCIVLYFTKAFYTESLIRIIIINNNTYNWWKNQTKKIVLLGCLNYIDVAFVFEVLGDNLLELIKAYNYRGLPLAIVKQIAKEVLKGLAYLHDHCSIIHTDLKPENVIFTKTEPICLIELENSKRITLRNQLQCRLNRLEKQTANMKHKDEQTIEKMNELRSKITSLEAEISQYRQHTGNHQGQNITDEAKAHQQRLLNLLQSEKKGDKAKDRPERPLKPLFEVLFF